MSVLRNVYHLDHANGTVTTLEGSNVKMERSLADWCGLSWAGTLTAHKCVLVKSAVTNTNYGGAISPCRNRQLCAGDVSAFRCEFGRDSN